jgi:DNA replication and repair protein RecF
VQQHETHFQGATRLVINEVNVKALRCHEQLRWGCSAGLNLVTGANGSGKTSLLESLYLMVYGRSFRQARDPFLVRRGEERFLIQGRWHRFGPMNLSVAGRRGRTCIRLQGRDVQRRKDISESFPLLVEAPQGRKLVDGSSSERRRWLDALVITCYAGMAKHYERYLRAVMQRNRLLRRRVLTDELDAWEQQIVSHGLPVAQARQNLLLEMNELLAAETDLTEQPLSFVIAGADYNQQDWLARLKSRRADDMRTNALRFGPHCDIPQLCFRQREIRSSGSRGQQRLAAIAVKMAECGLWSRHRRLIPVVLLDDALEALDCERQRRVLKRLEASPAQVLMTAPDSVNMPPDINIRIQHLTAGRLMEGGIAPRQTMTIMEEAA